MAKKEPTLSIRFVEPVHLHDVSNDIDYAIGDVAELPFTSAQRWIKRHKAVEHVPEPPEPVKDKADDSGSAKT